MASTITVQNLIDWGRVHNKLIPLVNVGGFTSTEPGLSIANDVKQTILSYPYKWKFNRSAETSFLTVDGTSEYTITLATDLFGYLDRAYAEWEADGATPKKKYTLEVVRDIDILDVKGDPRQLAMDRWTGTNGNVMFRVNPIPSSTIWRIYYQYQQKPSILTALTGAGGTFSPIPDDMGRALRQLFLAYSLKYMDDKRYPYEMKVAREILDEYRMVYDSEAHSSPMFIPSIPFDMYN